MSVYPTTDPEALKAFLSEQSSASVQLFDHFIGSYLDLYPVTLHPAKTMIGVATPRRRIAYVNQFGKNFLNVVFMFKQPYHDNLCFVKIAEVTGQHQFNHHLRIYHPEDINEEVLHFMKLAYEEGL
ncbi:DUF5655 domain-containing protein [Mucilaginibacter sp. RS28]|uniref:DUF5655 domain-containing protein n=1 Tax=Mucilaginibacter straminoryzae TaxID=2932774 RepID=A0A9X2BAK7_9SPHI|nr:DUF5655 domain-containing protein [Mucilaginibacter straminoryzae]MCJ8211501.1 DUF5655 domain-containing protein [Mucilaginibacter straminoryzae]